MRVAPAFVSCGVNRVVNALDWGDCGLIAYAGHRLVCVYEPQSATVVGTLTGHSALVSCVKWLPAAVNPPGASLLLSGSADNSIRVWAWLGAQHSPPWHCIAELQGHASPVTCLAVHVLPQSQQLLLASTSADPAVRLWLLRDCGGGTQLPPHAANGTTSGSSSSDQQQQLLQARFGAAAWQQQQAVQVGMQIQHCVALATLPEEPGCVLMATGGTDSTVRLWVMDDSTSSSGVGGARPEQQQLPPFALQCQLRGHENWVKGLAFTCVHEPEGRLALLLASAGQDRYGRIWSISTGVPRANTAAAAGDAAPPLAGGSGSSSDDAVRAAIMRYAPRPHLCAGGRTYWVTQEALLVGHEDWLNSVTWRPQPAAASTAAASCPQPPPAKRDVTLLSTSQDRSMMLWKFHAPSGLWMSEAAIGDAGSSCLGFYGGAFAPGGDSLVAHGFTGALHLWQQQQAASGGSTTRRLWVPQHALTGHFGAVQDVCWGADGACLQSVAADQTARLFTAVRGHWFELARTQVHGHDFSCLAAIPSAAPTTSSTTSSSCGGGLPLPRACLQYASGSEEKVLRVFDAPHAFTESLTAVRRSQSPEAAAATAAVFESAAAAAAALAAAGGGDASAAAAAGGRGRALGASVAALGLSNKAVYQGDDTTDEPGAAAEPSGGAQVGPEAYSEGPDFVPSAVPAVVEGPPLEEHLAQNTLWPEVRKLYGHGNDVFTTAASPAGTLLASACKAQSAGAAAVWVWEVGSWRAVAQLPGHTLTVTQLAFSPDGGHLLAGSRDRSFSVWRVPRQYTSAPQVGSSGGSGSSSSSSSSSSCFELLGRLKAAHSRIIWGVAWSHDGRFFATGSRDQTVKLWALGDVAAAAGAAAAQRPVLALPPCPAGVTAIALAPQHASTAAAAQDGASATGQQHHHMLAVGLEDGRLQVWRLALRSEADGGSSCEQLWASEPWEQHAASVRRLAWGAPSVVAGLCGDGDAGSGGVLHLASCGDDHSVRVWRLA